MRRKLLVVDTSFVVSLIMESEKHHVGAKKFFDENSEHYDFIAPELMLIEFVSFLVRKKNHESHSVTPYLDLIHNLVEIHANYASINSVYETIFKYKTRGADSIFVRLAERKNCEIITCDIDIKKKFNRCILIK